MGFGDDDDLSFCLTISKGIKHDVMLGILGQQQILAKHRSFEDFDWSVYKPGLTGLLNVFEVGDFLVTVESNGFLGVARRTITKVARLGGLSHYVAIQHSSAPGFYQYVEVQDGTIVANFDPASDPSPECVADFFRAKDGGQTPTVRAAMVDAVEYRLSAPDQPFKVQDKWLTDETVTYSIDYRTDRA